jgi:hypothetical protein
MPRFLSESRHTLELEFVDNSDKLFSFIQLCADGSSVGVASRPTEVIIS